MEIITPASVENPVFDDYLEAPVERYRSTESTRVQIGRPEWWFASDLFGQEWKPPQGDDVYLLVRLSYSLAPPEDHVIEDARLSAKLTSRSPAASPVASPLASPVAFDLFPREVTEKSQRDVTLKLKPSLKMSEVEASVGSVETTIKMEAVEPVVTSYGIGTSEAEWRFRKHKLHPLLGTRMLYLVVAYPSSASSIAIALDLDVNVRVGRFGSWLFKVPEKARAQLTRTIP